MTTSYEIHSGRRAVTEVTANTPHEALIDYLRSLGCADDDMVRVGMDAMSWHGAVYTAVVRTPVPVAGRAA
jgi:hypothetical protein